MNDYPIVTDENGVPRAPVPPSQGLRMNLFVN